MARFRIKLFLLILTVFFSIPFFVLPVYAQAADLGQNLVFSTSVKFDFSGRQNISATLRLVGEKAQYFFEDDFWNSRNSLEQNLILDKAKKIASEFDTRIYPLETSFWGSESNPGIDNDPKIFVVFTNLVDTAGGYFDTSNLYPKTRVSGSNEKDIIFLNVRSLLNASDRKAYSFLAHEFQHLISFNQKTILRNSDDDVWLNEIRSEYSPVYLGYDDIYEGSSLKRRVAAFLDEPTDSLTEWANESKDYGQVGLFGFYLTEHFGSNILSESLRSPESGIESVNTALFKNNFKLSFGEVFLRWSVANAINDVLLDPLFGYFKAGLKDEVKVLPTQVTSGVGELEAVISHEFKDWQAKWLWVSGFSSSPKNVLKANFSGTKKNFFKVASVVFYQNGSKEVKFFDLSNTSDVFFDLPASTEKIILIPVKMEKTNNFTSTEELATLRIVLQMVSRPDAEVVPVFDMPRVEPVHSSGRPSDYGLREGDFIRAEGDNDIYIINDFGYKRLVLSPKICLQYGHLSSTTFGTKVVLDKRGCFGAVKIVSSSVRDAFKTSWYFTNGETKDGKVFLLKQIGEDDAVLHHLNIFGDDFVKQGGDFKSVFLFNTLEQNSYFLGSDLKKLN